MATERSLESRRRFLARGALSLTVPPAMSLLSQLAFAAKQEKLKHKACILLFMEGGPSHIDTFDPKPNAPEGRGGPLKPISTDLAGVQVTELFPTLSQRMSDVCLIRSMSTPAKEHTRAQHLLRTGRLPTPNLEYPALGAIASSEIGDESFTLPNYVYLGRRPRRAAGVCAGYLGPLHEPLTVGDPKIDCLHPATSMDQFDERLQLLHELEKELQRGGASHIARAHNVLLKRSATMMKSAHLAAFELKGEPERLVEAYGNSEFGRNCLRARRLVEAGVPFVEVVSPDWDHHTQLYTSQKEGIKVKSAEVDAALSSLIDDLRSRGLLDTTLIVWMGEFGRTPKLRPLPDGGREHYPEAWTTLLAGGGLKTGQVIGRTDASGATVEERPVSVADFLTTICLAIGIDPHRELDAPNGRPIPIIDSQREPPKPLYEVL